MPISCSAQAQSSSRALRHRPPAARGEQPRRDARDADGLRAVDHEAALQLAHRGLADVLAAWPGGAGAQALVEVEDHALAQRAARRQQLGDAELRRERVEDREPAGDHRAALFLQARQRELVDAARRAGSAPSASAGLPA